MGAKVADQPMQALVLGPLLEHLLIDEADSLVSEVVRRLHRHAWLGLHALDLCGAIRQFF